MKNKFILGFGMLLSMLWVSAQSTISAKAVIKNIKEGKDVVYRNMTIQGELDFTQLDDKIDDLPKRWSKIWNSSNRITEEIDVPVTFENCVFNGPVLAYIHDEPSNYTFAANFNHKVVFKDCKFNSHARFKYSSFARVADFSGSVFNKDSNFKYAEFDEAVTFANTSYNDEANFKYTEFDENATFASSEFDEYANFKYAEFDDGVDFSNVLFNDDVDFKYLEVRGPFSFKNVTLEDDIEAKYADINGKSFLKYMADNR